MHTWIFGGGIVGEEDGAVPMGEDAGYARRSPQGAPIGRAPKFSVR